MTSTRFEIEQLFQLPGKGIVVMGEPVEGNVLQGDIIQLMLDGQLLSATVQEVETIRNISQTIIRTCLLLTPHPDLDAHSYKRVQTGACPVMRLAP